MARGWESKSVESQQDDAKTKAERKPQLTPAERERAEQRTALEMSISRAQAELQAACHQAHRDMLRLKLDTLRERLAELV
jgi:hypothetical protein